MVRGVAKKAAKKPLVAKTASKARPSEGKDPEGSTYCQVCDILLRPGQLEAHNKGKKHMKKSKAMKKKGDDTKKKSKYCKKEDCEVCVGLRECEMDYELEEGMKNMKKAMKKVMKKAMKNMCGIADGDEEKAIKKMQAGLPDWKQAALDVIVDEERAFWESQGMDPKAMPPGLISGDQGP